MATKKAKKQEVVVAYKGFDKDMKCRDFQFEVGQTYTHEGEVKACESGFHSCENPLDVLNYYPLISDNGDLVRFAIVEATGSISRHGDDSKLASASISIKAELKLPEIVAAAIKWVAAACTTKDTSASGHSSKLAASGDSSKLAASGHYSQLAASGHSSQLAASGDSSIVAGISTNCTASAGEKGCIVLTRWDDTEKRYRVSVGYVGENGIKPNTAYKLDKVGNFVEVAV